jgi:hypothetical protein
LPEVPSVSRLLLLAGAGGIALSALLPWVKIEGIGLDLGLIGAKVSPGTNTIAGTDTSVWPVILVIAAVVALLALFKLARRVLLVLGLLAIAAGGGLLYYCSNVVELELSGGSELRRRLAEELVLSSTGPGPAVLLASGILVVAGALLMR